MCDLFLVCGGPGLYAAVAASSGKKLTSKLSDLTLSIASPYAGNEPETSRQSGEKLFLNHALAEGGDQPGPLDGLHINEVQSGPTAPGHFVEESAVLVHESGADHAGPVEQLQKLGGGA